MTPLKELHDRVEEGDDWPSLYGGSPESQNHYKLIVKALGSDSWEVVECVTKSYRGSIDAAKALHDAVLPGWTLNGLWEKRHPDKGQHPAGKWVCLLFGIVDGKYYGPEVTSDNPARSWLLAILRALIDQAQENG